MKKARVVVAGLIVACFVVLSVVAMVARSGVLITSVSLGLALVVTWAVVEVVWWWGR